MSILETITDHDKTNPISRSELVDIYGMTDRNVRRNIEELRKKGHKICAVSRNGGYYMAKDEAEFKEFISDYISRAKTVFETANAMIKGVAV